MFYAKKIKELEQKIADQAQVIEALRAMIRRSTTTSTEHWKDVDLWCLAQNVDQLWHIEQERQDAEHIARAQK